MKKQVAEILLKIKAVTLNAKEPYRYVSGILSPIYCDYRLLMSYPEERTKIRDFFLELIKENNLEFDVVAGVATSGIPHAAWIADKLNKPMIYVRGKAKEHGKTNQIEGKLEKGQKVLVIEDLVSTGGSSVRAVNAVKEAGGEVVCCLAIFTYEMEKAKKQFEEANCKLLTLSNFSTLVGVASENNYITEEEKNKVIEWNKMPADWGKKMGYE